MNRFDEAIASLQRAVELEPGSADAHNSLARLWTRADVGKKQSGNMRKALAIDPEHVEVHFNYGNTLARLGRYDEAFLHYWKAIQRNPDYVAARNNLAAALRDCGRCDEAILECQQILRLQPSSASTRNILRNSQAQRRNLQQTLAHWRESLASNPNDSRALRDVAWLLATNPNASFRNGAEAVALAKRAVELSGGSEPMFLDTVAAAYAEAGRFPEALRTARQAAASRRTKTKVRWLHRSKAESGFTKPTRPIAKHRPREKHRLPTKKSGKLPDCDQVLLKNTAFSREKRQSLKTACKSRRKV